MNNEQLNQLVKQIEKEIIAFHGAVMMSWNHGPSRINPNP